MANTKYNEMMLEIFHAFENALGADNVTFVNNESNGMVANSGITGKANNRCEVWATSTQIVVFIGHNYDNTSMVDFYKNHANKVTNWKYNNVESKVVYKGENAYYNFAHDLFISNGFVATPISETKATINKVESVTA